MGGVKKTDKVITLEDFIAKSVKKHNDRLMVANIEVNGDLIPFNRPTDEDMLRYIDGISRAIQIDGDGKYKGQDMELMLDVSKDFVFASCKFLHNKELQESLEVVIPTDVVVKVFGIEGTIEIAGEIKEKFSGNDISEKVDSTIKN